MKKCDLCKNSYMKKDGKLYCPYSVCALPSDELDKILKVIAKKNK